MSGKHIFELAIRWLFVLCAAICGFAIAIPLSAIPHWLANKLDIQFESLPHLPNLAISGATAGFMVVFCGAISAPRYKSAAALMLLALGAYLAWNLTVLRVDAIQLTFENPVAKRTFVPFLGTLLGGILGVLLVVLLDRRLRGHPPKAKGPT